LTSRGNQIRERYKEAPSRKTTGTLPTSLKQIKMETDPSVAAKAHQGTLLTPLRAAGQWQELPQGKNGDLQPEDPNHPQWRENGSQENWTDLPGR